MIRGDIVRPLVLAALPLAAACAKGPSYGSPNAVIAVVDSTIREQVEPILRESLEREVFTTRSERIFEVTFTGVASLGEFRQWRRLVVVEPIAGATLVPELVDVPKEDGGEVVAEVRDEWARNQTVWVVAAGSPERTVELMREKADSLYEVIHGRYVDHQVARMWASGRDSALYRRMVDSLGFGIVLPRVYSEAPGSAPESARVFFNDDPRRVVSLSWGPRPAEVTADTVLALRRSLGEAVYPDEEIVGRIGPAEVADADTAAAADTVDAGPPIRVRRTTLAGGTAVRLQGVWRERDGASAGLFLTYGVPCGERLVLLDGNLYAPDRGKYPYLLQLERIFATFHCPEGGR